MLELSKLKLGLFIWFQNDRDSLNVVRCGCKKCQKQARTAVSVKLFLSCTHMNRVSISINSVSILTLAIQQTDLGEITNTAKHSFYL